MGRNEDRSVGKQEPEGQRQWRGEDEEKAGSGGRESGRHDAGGAAAPAHRASAPHVDGDEVGLALLGWAVQLLEPVELVVFDDLDLVFLVHHHLRDTREGKRQVLRILAS